MLPIIGVEEEALAMLVDGRRLTKNVEGPILTITVAEAIDTDPETTAEMKAEDTRIEEREEAEEIGLPEKGDPRIEEKEEADQGIGLPEMTAGDPRIEEREEVEVAETATSGI